MVAHAQQYIVTLCDELYFFLAGGTLVKWDAKMQSVFCWFLEISEALSWHERVRPPKVFILHKTTLPCPLFVDQWGGKLLFKVLVN